MFSLHPSLWDGPALRHDRPPTAWIRRACLAAGKIMAPSRLWEPCETGGLRAGHLRRTALILLLAGVLFLPFLGSRELASSHEARAAINATVVLERGCWGLPRLFDEQIELQKPPLYYWLVSLIAALRGQVDAWAVRLPAALAALGCLLWLYAVVARQGRATAGLLAAAILATMLHFTWLAQVGRVDMPLTLTIAVALGALFLGRDTWPWKLTGYLALGLGVLLKGPIALVLCAVVALANFAVQAWRQPGPDRWRGLARRIGCSSLRWGAGVVALVAGPWFVWANWETGGRHFEVFFWHHNLERGLGSETLAAHPWWFYLARFWIDLAPWSFVFPLALICAWRRRLLLNRSAADEFVVPASAGAVPPKGGTTNTNADSDRAGNAVCRFGLLWFTAMFVFLSCMSFKRADYLLPAYPGLAIFLGRVGQHWLRERTVRARHWSYALAAGFLVLYAAGWTTHHVLHAADWPYRDAAQRIRRHAGPDTPIIFFRTELHPLAFHLGRPMTTVLEWENLAIWANETRPIWFVMSAEHARQWREHIAGLPEAVLTLDELPQDHGERPLVVLRNCPRHQ